MIVNFSPKKLPEFLFYSRTLNKEKSLYYHRMFSFKTGEYLGEMITHPQDFYYFNLEVPGVRSLYIDYLKVFKPNEGLGTKFLDFAKTISKQKGLNGRLHLISSDCYDKANPPHVFYRKYGFDSRNVDKLKELDNAISQPKHKFSFNNIAMFFPPKTQVEQNFSQTKSFWKRLKQIVYKIYIHTLK